MSNHRLNQRLITEYFDILDIEKILEDCLHLLQDSLDFYIDQDKIKDLIMKNTKCFISNNNYIIQENDKVVFLEKYFNKFEKLNNCKINRNVFNEYLEEIINKNMGNYINRCIVCRVDMGEMNPRQYCCKTYCPEEKYDDY